MTDYNSSNAGYRSATKSDGTTTGFEADPVTGYCTLTAGTFYFSVGGTPHDTALESAHVQWSALVAGVFTFEDTNFPGKVSGGIQGADHVTIYQASTDGAWVPENPSTAIVAISNTSNSNASSAATVTAGGTTGAGAMWHLGNFGARRGRIKAVLTVGGSVRLSTRGKVGA